MKLEFANQELKDFSLRAATKATIQDQKLLKRQTAVAQAAAVAEMTANKSAAKKLNGTVGRQVAQDESIALQAQVSSLDKELSQVKGEQSKFESLEVQTKKSHEIKMRNQQKDYAHKLQEIEDQSIVYSANAKIAEEQRLGFIQKNLEVQEKMKEKQANVVRTQDSLATTLTQQTELRKAEEAAATERDKLKSFNREMQRMSRVKETYRFGEMNTTKCQAGDVKITNDKECRAATSALLPDGKYKGSSSKSNEPGGYWAGTGGNGYFNSNMAGQAAQGRRPICKSASEHDIRAEVADINLKSSITLATARASSEKATDKLDSGLKQELTKIRDATYSEIVAINETVHKKILEVREANNIFKKQELKTLAADTVKQAKLDTYEAINISAATKAKKDGLVEELAKQKEMAIDLRQADARALTATFENLTTAVPLARKALKEDVKQAVKNAKNKLADIATQTTEGIEQIKKDGHKAAVKAEEDTIKVVKIAKTKMLLRLGSIEVIPLDATIITSQTDKTKPPKTMYLPEAAKRLKLIPEEIKNMMRTNGLLVTGIKSLSTKIQKLELNRKAHQKNKMQVDDENGRAGVMTAILLEHRKNALMGEVTISIPDMVQRRQLLQVQRRQLLSAADDDMNTRHRLQGVCKYKPSGTFVTSQGKKIPGQTPFILDRNTSVFGAEEGAWFKMKSVDSNGKPLQSRYIKKGTVNSIDQLTAAIWQTTAVSLHKKRHCEFDRPAYR